MSVAGSPRSWVRERGGFMPNTQNSCVCRCAVICSRIGAACFVSDRAKDHLFLGEKVTRVWNLNCVTAHRPERKEHMPLFTGKQQPERNQDLSYACARLGLLPACTLVTCPLHAIVLVCGAPRTVHTRARRTGTNLYPACAWGGGVWRSGSCCTVRPGSAGLAFSNCE